MVFNVTGGSDLTLHEVNVAAEIIYEVVDADANIIFGAVIDDRLQGEMRITVIATGFNGEKEAPKAKPAAVPKAIANNSNSSTAPVERVETTEEEDTLLAQPPELDIPDFLQKRRFPRR